MKYGEIIVEKKEFALLRNIMGMAHYHKDDSYKTSIEKLNDELKSARVVHRRDLPEDVIRFNSTVTIQTAFDVKKSYQIVTPEKSNIKLNKISVLAPMGLALFGYAQGDEILWKFPVGESFIKILEVNQLELV
ncbi:GreA/GreB family elongation factor [Antarcticibacterium arcticum]|uniref:GreA/GreB family elongation factor n=1 Tax=Antarcticibacterium arcticum TaxID=2585771 RepID=A0A5B8YP95_9FLAO|nr:GreA/GreB family elongation factor [Antarcticibacterium arcticum]QED37699.1 GreA/GreB family elongation factor [Antarcticibacterium arcticum]